MKKQFELTEDFIKHGYIHCNTLEEYENMVIWFISNAISISDDLKYTKEGIYTVYYDGTKLHNCPYPYITNPIIIEWSDYMTDTEEINPTKKQYNLIELSELPNGSRLYFERLNTKIHVYIANNGIIKYEDDNKPLSPSKDNLKATFTLVSLPPKEVSFKEAVEHYSKGGNIKSILNSIKKTYVGLKTDNIQKHGLVADGGINITVDEILNAKWYIVD